MGLREEILNQPISDLPLRPAVSVASGTTVRQVLAAMRHRKMGCALIVDDGAMPIGMFNEKLLMRMLVDGSGSLDDPVDQHMTVGLACVPLGDPIAKLIATMQTRKLRWICVTDDAGRVHSITGCKGLFEYLVDHFPRSVKVRPLRSILSMEHREGA